MDNLSILKVLSDLSRPLVRRSYLFIAGCLSIFAFAPWHILLVSFAAFSFLLLAMQRETHKKGLFFSGWIFGLGHFGCGMAWLTHAFLVNPEQHAVFIVPAILGLGAFLGLYAAFACLFIHRTQTPLARLISFVCGWIVVEWVRGFLFTGLPWNITASVTTAWPLLMQPLALLGPYGYGAFLLFLFGLPSLFLTRNDLKNHTHHLTLGIVFFIGTGLLFWSHSRLDANPTENALPQTAVRIVQANIPQKDKWNPALRREHLEKHIALSRQAGFRKTDIVIWPETALTYSTLRADGIREALQKATPPRGYLVTGMPRFVVQNGRLAHVFNSVVTFGKEGQIADIYDKSHLVPFGEYIPFSKWLPLEKLTEGRMDFSAGSGTKAVSVGGLPPFTPLICYEVIFPAAVLPKKGISKWLLNVTNDGWYGKSAGPHQHLAAARMRAVEEGVPLIRAANTGISAVIDSYGRLIAHKKIDKTGNIDIFLPAASDAPFFSKIGHFPAIFILVILRLLQAIAIKRAKKGKFA